MWKFFKCIISKNYVVSMSQSSKHTTKSSTLKVHSYTTNVKLQFLIIFLNIM